MSRPDQPSARHHVWCRIYRALLVLLPRAMREKHGASMVALFMRDLERCEGIAARTRTGMVAMGDLLRRGLYERVMEERAALTSPHVQALHGLARTFGVAFVVLTALFVGNYSLRIRHWDTQLASLDAVLEAVALAIPFTVALTLPMAVFIAVLATAARSGYDTNGDDPHATPRTNARLRLVPLVAVTSLLALVAFAWNAEVVPRSNARLVELQAVQGTQTGGAALSDNAARAMRTSVATDTRSDRAMTFTELRVASERASHDLASRELAVGYGVELHKKPAIAFACVVFALLAAGIARRVRRTGVVVQAVASVVVFTTYYLTLAIGESLADQLVVSPATAMWGGNVLLLGVALLALWQPGDRNAERSPLQSQVAGT